MEEGRGGMLFHLPHLNLRGIHVPEHFTGIWVQGKPRQLGKSVITLELPISYDCYCCFQHFSKEATEWHLCGAEGLEGLGGGPDPAHWSRLGSVRPKKKGNDNNVCG